MDKLKASEHFRKGEKLNCAQAVARFAEQFCKRSTDFVARHSDHGGGKAPEGYCGALYAALEYLNSDNKTFAKQQFKKLAGSTRCREIRKSKRLTCPECVDLAGDCIRKTFLEEQADD
ncbi:hypothetical protein P0136_09320 [Lentisphaerota bacterium ZTH]|nr:hypothetical protein JYG24_13170 [Lentisphaerota bacterium]WET05563.1 hypothetical protein P0136_09320 [Lentisphaerota bacterium ZTH]